jgi:FtsH-binding integral membrane protein
MNLSHPRLAGPVGAGHPAVRDRRIQDATALGLTALIPVAIGLGLTLGLPHPNLLLVLGGILAALGVVWLIVYPRLEVTVAVLAVYLLMIDGPVKLGIGGGEATAAVRNVLTLAICLGAVLRLLARRERIQMPPLSAWVLGFVGIVLIEAFNPKTHGLLKILGGFRQQLQWIPFFFFGYALIRSKRRFRQLFVIVGVCALANGIVSSYQTGLSPSQLASWGPGYGAKVTAGAVGGKSSSSRTYFSEGEARVRPLGLGADAGFGGGVGVLALPFTLALFATWRSRRRWIAAVLCLGALVAVVTGLGRLQVVGAALGVIAFAALAAAAGPRMTRAFVAMLAVVVLAVPLGFLFVSAIRPGTFKRYESIEPNKVAETAPTHKASSWEKIPAFLEKAPFGVGLGTVGAASGFGGRITELVEGHTVSAETQYNFIADELGAPGLLLWLGLSVYVIVLTARRLRHTADGDLAICLAGAMAPFIALTLEGFSGPFTTSAASGPYFWFAIGIAAYWFGTGRYRNPTVADQPVAA